MQFRTRILTITQILIMVAIVLLVLIDDPLCCIYLVFPWCATRMYSPPAALDVRERCNLRADIRVAQLALLLVLPV